MITDVYSFVRLSYKCPVIETCVECPRCEIETSITKCENDVSDNMQKDKLVKNQMANSYSEELEIKELNEKTFDGWVSVLWMTKLELGGDAVPNSTLKIHFDDDDMFFMVPVDNDGKWKLSLKNIFNFGTHDIHASLILDGEESEIKGLGKFNIVNYWYIILSVVSSSAVVLYIYKKYFKQNDKKISNKK